MVKGYKDIISNYFKENSFVESNIKSFNRFIEKDLPRIVDDIGDIIPTIIPQEVENFKIKLNDIKVGMPEITEADGSKRKLYPVEARLRKLTYSAPITLGVSAHINDIQRESFQIEIGRLPIMLKSKYCHLANLKKADLIKHGEDPVDWGGYFILNGNERVLISVEDLASNKLFVKKAKIGISKYVGKLYSEHINYRIPHTFEQMKDGSLQISFARFKRVPIISVIKALGLTKDQEIMQFISPDKVYDDIILNLYESIDLKSQDDAVDFLARKIGMAQREMKNELTLQQMDRYLLPHLGMTPKDRIYKAYNLCKLVRRFLMVSADGVESINQDHYVNKRLKQSGDLLSDLFRVNMRSLVQDMLYNFQRLVKRGKFSSIRIIIREQLLSSRIKSAMATGSWPGGRAGISQNISRVNAIDTTSHSQRVASLLTASQENFDARALHSTHWGRLCPVETPEGTPIGLRKNLALLANVTDVEPSNEKILKLLETNGLRKVE
jgi:DNA-directed RNA polymerase beta subunit